MKIRSKAPLRIGLAGGGTDVSPYSDLFNGAILNATINLYAYCTIIPLKNQGIKITSSDNGISLTYKSSKELEIDGELDLQKGVINRLIKDYQLDNLSFEMITSMDVPSGSGLGSSSTLVVAIIGAFVEWLKLPLGEYDIAQLAFSIEREDLKMKGGKQDQYAATFGGFNFMEFLANDKVIVNPLRLKQEIIDEIQLNLVLYYSRSRRKSSNIIEEQIKNTEVNQKDAVNAMHEIKKQAFQMKEALIKGELEKIGNILDEGWISKKKMASAISNSQLDNIYEAAKNVGAIGGKVSGAGGGGFMIFYVTDQYKYKLLETLRNFGGEIKNYQFVKSGLTHWSI